MSSLTIAPDLSAVLTSADGTRELRLPSYDPRTMVPFGSAAEVEACALALADNPAAWTAVALEPEQAYYTQLSPPTFLLLFTSAERIAIRQAAAYAGSDADELALAAAISDWLSIVNDPRLQIVNLELPATIDGINILVPAGILTAARAAEILRGFPK